MSETLLNNDAKTLDVETCDQKVGPMRNVKELLAGVSEPTKNAFSGRLGDVLH